MEAEKQARMLEMEAEKQAKMLEIEAANVKTKGKEVALASMKTGVEIMKVDLNTVSPRKRPWFEKMQRMRDVSNTISVWRDGNDRHVNFVHCMPHYIDMLKFDEE
ncbi:Protein UXT-like protein [Hordeum vulgare]|nr:Protein UXT-like protein [Hordeum vulgare]